MSEAQGGKNKELEEQKRQLSTDSIPATASAPVLGKKSKRIRDVLISSRNISMVYVFDMCQITQGYVKWENRGWVWTSWEDRCDFLPLPMHTTTRERYSHSIAVGCTSNRRECTVSSTARAQLQSKRSFSLKSSLSPTMRTVPSALLILLLPAK